LETCVTGLISFFNDALVKNTIQPIYTKFAIMKTMLRLLWVLGICCSISAAQGQSQSIVAREINVTEAGTEIQIPLPESCRSWVIRSAALVWDTSAWFLHQGVWLKLQQDPHGPDQFAQSELVFSGNTGNISLIFSQPGRYMWYGINPGDMVHTAPRNTRNEMPELIPQSVWRQGLADPKPNPVSTPTHHAIVHHSAGSTFDTNYTAVVRSYYLLHTEINGWDDIGYNYLIARDGSIFAGRDPQNMSGVAQDNVRGAHFCAKNQYTMGICVIGDFTTNTPAAAAINSLCKLLAWKFEKDEMNPRGVSPHPDAGSPNLAVLAGHRDGCATACPGNVLYAEMNAIRDCVALRLPLHSSRHELPGFRLLSEPGYFGFHFENPGQARVEIFDLSGRSMQVIEGHHILYSQPLPSGVWPTRITQSGRNMSLRLLVP
jgi:hypothetical protein